MCIFEGYNRAFKVKLFLGSGLKRFDGCKFWKTYT